MAAKIEAGPIPCRDRERCLRSPARFAHPGLVVGLVLPAFLQPVVQPHPHDVVGDAGMQAERQRRRIVRIAGANGIGGKIHVQIFDLATQVSDQVCFHADARCPAQLGRLIEKARGIAAAGGDWIGIGVERRRTVLIKNRGEACPGDRSHV